MQTVGDIISAFPSTAEFAAKVGVTISAAQKWRQRNSIPPEKLFSVQRAAKKQGVKISIESLLEMRLSRGEEDGHAVRAPQHDKSATPAPRGEQDTNGAAA